MLVSCKNKQFNFQSVVPKERQRRYNFELFIRKGCSSAKV